MTLLEAFVFNFKKSQAMPKIWDLRPIIVYIRVCIRKHNKKGKQMAHIKQLTLMDFLIFMYNVGLS